MTVDELIAHLQRYRGDARVVLGYDSQIERDPVVVVEPVDGAPVVMICDWGDPGAAIPPEMLRIWCDGATGDWHDASGRVCCGTIPEAEAAQIAARLAAERGRRDPVVAPFVDDAYDPPLRVLCWGFVPRRLFGHPAPRVIPSLPNPWEGPEVCEPTHEWCVVAWRPDARQ